MSSNKWDMRFLKLARHIAEWSKDPSTQVGAVIVDSKHRVLSLGYNGFPRGIKDDPKLLNDREKKYERVVHAEMNAILFATCPLEGATLYTWPMHPCSRCAAMIIQVGIKRVVSIETDHDKWKESIELSKNLFYYAGVSYYTFTYIYEGDD